MKKNKKLKNILGFFNLKTYNQKLKIAQLTPYYFPSIGGVESVVKYTSEELVKRGHSVHVITSNRDHNNRLKKNIIQSKEKNGVTIHRLKSILNFGHMSFFPDCYKVLMDEDFDIIHSHVFRHPHLEIANLVGKIKKIPVVLHGHSPFFKRGEISAKKLFYYSLYDFQAKLRFLKNINKIIALTEFEKNRYLNLGVQHEKIAVIPNAASDDCFQKVNPKPFLKKHNLQGKKIILFIGNLNNVKRPDLLLRALAKLIIKNPKVFLLLVGPDEGMLKEITLLAKNLKVENHYAWLGPLYGKDKLQVLSAAKLFILPSDLDALPLVLVEAMAQGIPVIGSNAIGPSEIIDDGETGFIVRKRNVEDIVNASLKLLNNRSLYNKMGHKAKHTAENKYRVSKIVDNIEKIYYDLLS